MLVRCGKNLAVFTANDRLRIRHILARKFHWRYRNLLKNSWFAGIGVGAVDITATRNMLHRRFCYTLARDFFALRYWTCAADFGLRRYRRKVVKAKKTQFSLKRSIS